MPAVVLLSFTVPKIYELNKHEIDNAAHTGYKKVHPVQPVLLRMPSKQLMIPEQAEVVHISLLSGSFP